MFDGQPACFAAIAALLLAGSAAAGDEPAAAQQNVVAPGVRSSADGTRIIYDAAYFEPYQAVTAADMLRWVPGGAQLVPEDRTRFDEDDKRGFGSGGDQILINGKRISGKANDIGSALRRIRADTVTRVELIRGTTAGLDVRSEGTLINIVLNEERKSGAGTWQLHSGFYGREDPEYDGLLSWSAGRGDWSYLVSAQYGPYNRGNQVEFVERYFAPEDGALTERRDIERPLLDAALILNGSVSAAVGAGGTLNVNGRLVDRDSEENEIARIAVVGDPNTTVLTNLSAVSAYDWELGGDLEQRLGSTSLKTRAIVTRSDQDESQRVSLASTDPGNVPAQSLVRTASLATEAILRSSLSFEPRPGQLLEIGLEGARNELQQDVALFEVLADGTLEPVDLFNAASDVVEDRYELFATHFWQPGPDVALESAVNVEYSTIGQQGRDVDNERSFTFVKPRFDLRFDLNDTSQLRATLERTVSQLDFADFVAGFDSDDDQVNAGNPGLEPERAWEYRLTFERRLADDRGVLEARLFFNDIEDHIDNIPVGPTQSAVGNIGDAENPGLTLRASLRLGGIGLDGAVLDASYTVQDSSTTDPFTGVEREMSDKQRQEYNVTFRHDLPAWHFNYNVEVEWNGERTANDFNFRERTTSVRPRTHVGMQYRLTNSVLLWFDTRVAFDGHNRRTRERYVDNVADGVLLRREIRDQYFRREYIVGLRGQF